AVKEMRLPVLLVASNRLGAINSALLSVEALRSRDIKIVGVIFNNNIKGEDRLVLKDNPVAVERFGRVHVLGTLAYSKDMRLMRKSFVRIAAEIESKI
ncbi:MAG: AAA family ATPase, partial [Candidatus Omnitrophica bacterium]|nr:AAA family ATPase [Candidatus Omnitrophota bacterium]